MKEFGKVFHPRATSSIQTFAPADARAPGPAGRFALGAWLREALDDVGIVIARTSVADGVVAIESDLRCRHARTLVVYRHPETQTKHSRRSLV